MLSHPFQVLFQIGQFPFCNLDFLFRVFREKLFQIVGHVHRTPHQHVVTGKRADVRIRAFFRRSDELDYFFLAMVNQFAGPENFLAIGNKTNRKSAGAQCNCCQSHFIGFAGIDQHDVVRHIIRIGERQFYLLPRLHGEFRNVISHAFANRPDTNRGQFRCVAENTGLLCRRFLRFRNHTATHGSFDIEPQMFHRVRSNPGMRFGRLQQHTQ